MQLTLYLHSCISFDSYIKPQPDAQSLMIWLVVYLLIPTSNHNGIDAYPGKEKLYIF